MYKEDYSSKIVLGRLENGKERLFLEYKIGNNVTYRNYRKRIRKSDIKYGPYNTIKRHPIKALFVDGGKIKYNIDVIDIVEELDHKCVGVGYSSVDRKYI
jgi:hypothetical protein